MPRLHIQVWQPDAEQKLCKKILSCQARAIFFCENLATYCKQEILIIKLGKLFSQSCQVSFLVVKTAKGTFKYMTLGEGEREFAQTVKSTVICGGGGLAKSSYNFIVAKKCLIYSLFCSIYGVWGRRVGWKRHMGEESKIAQKPSCDIWTFPNVNAALVRLYA